MIPTIKSLLIGSIGGAAFFALELPLAWMMGSMCIITLLALKGVELQVNGTLRKCMMAVLGVMLGTTFSPETVNALLSWGSGLVLLFVSMFASMISAYYYFRKIGKFDQITSYFSAAPGGFNVMYEMGEALGGNGRYIALVHATRVLMLVMVVPLAFRFSFPDSIQISEINYLGAQEDLFDYGILLVAGAIGYGVAGALKIPAHNLLGPMCAAAALSVSGATTASPPNILIYAAQLVIGTAIGLRFLNTSVTEVRNVILLSFGSTAIMLALAVIFSILFTDITGLSVSGLILSLAPGGLAEMALVALALGLDVAFVSAMHVVRIVAIVTIIPAIYPLFKRIISRSKPNYSP